MKKEQVTIYTLGNALELVVSSVYNNRGVSTAEFLNGSEVTRNMLLSLLISKMHYYSVNVPKKRFNEV